MLDVSVTGQQDLLRMFRAAPPAIQTRLIRTVAKQILAKSKARASAQTDLDGMPYPAHKLGRRRKMLIRLVRRLKILDSTNTEALIGFGNSYESMIAAKQQFGFSQHFTRSSFRNGADDNHARPLNYNDPATRRQAKALLDAGYKVRRRGGISLRPTIKWITENLTMGRAGLILKILRAAPEEWTTTLPPRSFLGGSVNEMEELTALALSEMQQAVNQL